MRAKMSLLGAACELAIGLREVVEEGSGFADKHQIVRRSRDIDDKELGLREEILILISMKNPPENQPSKS